MDVCDREGRIYDVWISFGSMHEVRAFRVRKSRSLWFRELVENCVVYGDRGYRGCEGVIACDSKDMRAKRQVVEGVISQIKLFNAGSGSGKTTITKCLVGLYRPTAGKVEVFGKEVPKLSQLELDRIRKYIFPGGYLPSIE